MRNTSTIALGVVIAGVVSLFLIGLRLEARWAGGQGPIEVCSALNVQDQTVEIRRGQIMGSSPTDFAKFQLCDGTLLYLDTNTQVRLADYRDVANQKEAQLELLQGRLIVDGLADVRARNTILGVRGAGCEFVHYSWRDELDVTPLAIEACKIESPEQIPTSIPPAFQTSRLNTYDAALLNVTPFSPSTSSANTFYTWTDLQLEGLR
jgi:hypothetical protein